MHVWDFSSPSGVLVSFIFEGNKRGEKSFQQDGNFFLILHFEARHSNCLGVFFVVGKFVT